MSRRPIPPMVATAALFAAVLGGCSADPPPRRPPGRPPEAVVPRTAWGPDLEAGEIALKDGRFDRAEQHLLAAQRALEQHESRDVDALARVHRALGKLYGEHLRADLALPHLEAALQLDTERGPDHPRALEDRLAIGVVLDAVGEHAEAVRRLRELLARLVALHGREGVEVARVQAALATALGHQHDYREAETLHHRALAILQPHEQDEPLVVAEVLAGLATIHYTRSQLRDARAQLERALGLRERYQGREHPHVASVLFEIAAIDLAEGRLPEAEKTCGRAVAIRKRTLPASDARVVASIERLVQILHRRGKAQEAAKLEAELAKTPR